MPDDHQGLVASGREASAKVAAVDPFADGGVPNEFAPAGYDEAPFYFPDKPFVVSDEVFNRF